MPFPRPFFTVIFPAALTLKYFLNLVFVTPVSLQVTLPLAFETATAFARLMVCALFFRAVYFNAGFSPFTVSVFAFFASFGTAAVCVPPQIPGDAAAPYYVPKGTDGQPAKFLKAKPLTDMEKCTKCGDCVKLCPVGSINPADVADVPGICIKCQACIRGCKAGAKYFDDAAFLSHVAMLEQNFTARKENEFFL